MNQLNSHCSYCGTKYDARRPWPRQCRACGNWSYLNPLPVVVVLVPVKGGLVGIRRNIEPHKGSIVLPGGFLDRDESWQEGGSRELLEETGIELPPGDIALYDVMSGEDGTLLVFGLVPPQPENVLLDFCCEETAEVLLIERPMELGFEMHTKVVARYFGELAAGSLKGL